MYNIFLCKLILDIFIFFYILIKKMDESVIRAISQIPFLKDTEGYFICLNIKK